MKKLMMIVFLLIPLTITAAPTNPTVIEFFWDAPTTNVDGSPLSDLDGFKIYCRTENGSYPVNGFDVPSVNTRSVKIADVVDMTIDAKYVCTATAYDVDGHEGAYGPEAVFLVVAGVAQRAITIPGALPSFGVR